MKPSPLSPMIQNSMDQRMLDDEVSTISTVTVCEFKKSVSIRSSLSAKKSVSFDLEEICSIPATIVLEPEDIGKLWWSYEDYKKFRGDKHKCLQQILRYDLAQKKVDKDRRTFLPVLHRIFEACCEVRSESDREMVTQLDHQRFQLYIHSMDFRHGVERATSNMLSNDKMGRRQYLTETLLQLQSEWRHHLTKDILADFLRDASQNISRPSRLFALRLAAAHAFNPNKTTPTKPNTTTSIVKNSPKNRPCQYPTLSLHHR